jgi:homospermidine synthase
MENPDSGILEADQLDYVRCFRSPNRTPGIVEDYSDWAYYLCDVGLIHLIGRRKALA